MKCINCGQEIHKNAKICNYCGSPPPKKGIKAIKIAKLVIGIVTLSCIFFLLFTLVMGNQLDGCISFFIICFFIAAGVISICTCNNNHIITDLLPAIFYTLIGVILLSSLKYFIPQRHMTIILFATMMFVLAVLFLNFAVDKYTRNKHSQVSVIREENTCVYCNTKTTSDICPYCETPISFPVDKALTHKGFVISKAFNGLYCAIFIDDINKKWCVFDRVEHLNKGVYPYSDLIKVELYKDETPVPNGRFCLCRAMYVLAYINNLYTPVITIKIIKQPLYTNSQEYAGNLAFAMEVISTFEYMINKLKRVNEE